MFILQYSWKQEKEEDGGALNSITWMFVSYKAASLVTSNLIEQPAVPDAEVSIIPEHGQQSHVHVVWKAAG